MSLQAKWSCIYYFFSIVYSSFQYYTIQCHHFKGKKSNFFFFWGAQLQFVITWNVLKIWLLDVVFFLSPFVYFIKIKKDPEEGKVHTSQAVENTWKILSQPRIFWKVQEATCHSLVSIHTHTHLCLREMSNCRLHRFEQISLETAHHLQMKSLCMLQQLILNIYFL